MVELSTRKWEIGGNHYEKLGLKEFPVRVNWPSLIRQERVPIRRELTPRRGLPNPIRQVVPLISHIRSYPPYHSDLHPPSLSFSSTTQPSSQNTKLSHPSLSLHVVIMSWHRVQHTPSTASTQDCLSSLHSHDYELTPQCSFSFRRTSLYDRLPSASSPCELKSKVTLSHSHGCKLTNWWIEFHYPVRRPSTASKYTSNLARSRPPSASPNSLDHGHQVYLQTHSITACKFAQAWPPSASPISLDYSLQVHLQTPLITASKFTRSLPPRVSPNTLDYRLQVHLETRSITACKFTRSLPPSVSRNTLDYHLQVHLQSRSIMACKFTRSLPPSVSPNTLDYRLQVHLQTGSITASEYISKFTRSSFSGAPRIALKHRLQPVQI